MRDESCVTKRTGRYIEPKDLGIQINALRLYALKDSCQNCNDYTTISGQPYCLQSYTEIAKRL